MLFILSDELDQNERTQQTARYGQNDGERNQEALVKTLRIR